MSFATPSEICRLRKLAADAMCNLGMICHYIDEMELAATNAQANQHNEALESLREAAITIPYNIGALETALPREIKA